MPIHDWFPIDANVFHHFHQSWTIAICDALNAGLLPAGYSALVKLHSWGLIPDVLAMERLSRPDRLADPVGGVLTATPPKTSLVRQAKADFSVAHAVNPAHKVKSLNCTMKGRANDPLFVSILQKGVLGKRGVCWAENDLRPM
jgi:hypothetical protein